MADGRRTRSVSNKHKANTKRYWSSDVMQKSNALDLKGGVFRMSSPRKIAMSLKRSSERSKRRKGTPYQSAMSMLNFYINRAGKTLSPTRKRILQRAKPELRKVFGRDKTER
ncbi:MAG TPA: DUF3175 domain-containing protein [Nitrospira sp.]|nr:DUF3175 domain-containing protein [Nitrospira sp.]